MDKNLIPHVALLAAGFIVPAHAQFTLSLGVQSNQLEVESHTQLFFTNFSGPDTKAEGANVNLNDWDDNQATNIAGELAAGYQFNYDAIYNVAIEIFGQVTNTQVDVPVSPNGADFITTLYSVPVADASASFDWMAGIRIRPGYYVTPSTRLFIDGGILWGGFELEQDDALQAFINKTLATDFDQTENETLFGWRYGAGVEYKFNEMMVLGIDYIITQFESFESDFIEDAAELGSIAYGSPVNAHAEYTPIMHTLGLNFKVLFGGTQKQASSPVNVMKDK